MAATVTNRPLTQYVGDTNSDLFIRDVSKFPSLVKRIDYPFFTSVKQGEPLAQPKHKLEWGIRHIPPVNDTVTETLANEAGPSTVTPANIGYYQIGHIILFPASEQVRVTAVGASTLTVTRAFAGTTSEALADNAGIRIIGIAAIENAESALGPVTQGEVDYNYFQILDKMIQLSNRARNTPTYEISGDRLTHWLNMTLEIEMPHYMELTSLNGVRSIGSTTVAPSMGGIFSASFASSNVDLNGDILTEYQFLEGLQKAYNQVGSSNVGKRFMSHPFYKRIAANWTRDIRVMDVGDKKFDMRVDTYATDFGTVEWMMNHHMADVNDPTLPDGRLISYDPADLTYRPYSSDSKWAIYSVYEGGWYSRRAVRGDYTLEALNPEKRVTITEASKVALDYPNFVNP